MHLTENLYIWIDAAIISMCRLWSLVTFSLLRNLCLDYTFQISGIPHVVKRALYEISSLLHRHPRKENPSLEDLIFASTNGLYTPGPSLPPSMSQGNQGWSHKHPGLHEMPMPRFGGFMNKSPGYAPGGYDNGHARDSHDLSDEFSMRILCATEKIGGLIGKGGVNVRQLEQHTGAHIQVEDTGPEADERVVLISSKEVSIPRLYLLLILCRCPHFCLFKTAMQITNVLLIPRLLGIEIPRQSLLFFNFRIR